jgi:hypothetical protein
VPCAAFDSDSLPVSDQRLLSQSARLRDLCGFHFKPELAAMWEQHRGWKYYSSDMRFGTSGALSASDVIVMIILRHSRVTITRDRYAKVQDPQVLAAMEELSRALDNGPRSRAAGSESNPS